MTLENWILENKIKAEKISEKEYWVDGVGKFLLITPKEDLLFNEQFHLLIDNEEKFIKTKDFYLFEFGGNYFYTSVDTDKDPQLNIFKHIGQAEQNLEIDNFAFLGVHGPYEILNGSGNYVNWCKKAKFLGYKGLGICEKNTLAGLFTFQGACKQEDIKGILGETITINQNHKLFDVKVFVLDKKGYGNLLHINEKINVQNSGFIKYDELKNLGEGLVIIFNPLYEIENFDDYLGLSRYFSSGFFQIDSVVWDSNKTDERYLFNIKRYLDADIYHKLPPILCNDAYYIDKDEWEVKKYLNKIGGVGFQNDSKNQYFKNLDDNFEIFGKLFKDTDERFFDLFKRSINNVVWVYENSNFSINTDIFHLPNFYTDEGINKDDLFFELLEKAFEIKIVEKGKDVEKYKERLKEEIRVIKKGGFIDYFLILWDIVEMCKRENILIGIGRGSASGSLISYLLDITKIDPIEYNLLFNRFLNEGRIGKSLPDVDIDFESERKDEVKLYLEKKYGANYVCSVGTYGTLKLRSGLKDLAKIKGIDFSYMNILSKALEIEDDLNWKEVFINAVKNPQLKDFVKKNVDIINILRLILGQPRNTSVHPSAYLILPNLNENNEKADIHDFLPVRKLDDKLISEWEGPDLEEAGYLKEDILGLIQLDKFHFIIDSIEKQTNRKIDIYDLPLDDGNVYNLFKKGYNQDLHHFKSPGLTGYSIEIQPNNIEDLSSMIALYRPGSIQSNAHNDYVSIKFGKKKAVYDFGLKEVTKLTYGLYIYQEQVIQATQVLGDFNPIESDDIRKAMGKSIKKLILEYKTKFITNAIAKGCPEKEADIIWKKLEVFSGYGFNRSHSVAYAIMGYIGQWFKYHYPIHFWTAAFEFAKKENVVLSGFISEIQKLNTKIKIEIPDVNSSYQSFYTDYEKGIIYWSLSKIAYIGPIAIESILEERKKGLFKSFDDFCDRVDKGRVSKSIIENLIFAGSFDLVENIIDVRDRKKLFDKYYEKTFTKTNKIYYYADTPQNRKLGKANMPYGGEVTKVKFDSALEGINVEREYPWLLIQKEISGLGFINYKKIIDEYFKSKNSYIDNFIFTLDASNGKRVVIAGIVVSVTERKMKKKAGHLAEVALNINDDTVYVTIWSEIYEKFKIMLTEAIGKIMIVDGKVDYNDHKKVNVLQTEEYTEILILE